MRNFKKFLSLTLAMLMVLSMSVFTAGATEANADYLDAAQHLAAIGVMKGDENGDLMLDKHVTRYQAALFFVQAITGKTDSSVWNADKSAIFTDVPEYGTAIDYLANLGLIVGRGNGIYGYNDTITYQEMLTLAVRALGYERENMSYPYDYILEAQKLGLTKNIENLNFKAELRRDETAQLIWDMLGTEIAITDPISGETVYPGKQDESAYGIIVGPGKIKRETYLEKSGFAAGKMVVTVTEFTKADGADDIDTVTVQYGDTSYTMAAADLGITADTAKIDYLGLPLTMFVNCKAEEFFDKYDTDASENDARVVFVNTDALTALENLGDAGTIRYVVPTSGSPYITLNGVKFASDKYDVVVYEFGADGWNETDGKSFADNFLYDVKDGYIGANANGAVRYIVRETTEGGETVKTLHIYYMPYAFGQYFVRTLKDSTTGKNASFVTIGSYEATKVENKDGDKSNFVEYLLGTASKVTSSTTSVSKKNGELAKSVTLAGEDIESGEFMFYYYNAVDNILTVAANHGGFRTGQLTGTSAGRETVKIGGVQHGFGFKGAYAADYATYAANEALIKTIMQSYESGKDNVKYVSVDGNIVYLESYDGTSSAATYGFALVTVDPEILADLMGVAEDKLEYTDAFVLDDSGNVAIAVLNTESGEWELKSLKKLYKDYNTETEKYAVSGDMGAYAGYAALMGESFSKYAEYAALTAELQTAGIFAIVGERGDVLDLGTVGGAVEYAEIAEGLIFSDVANKTNKITADPDASAARVTLDDDTVIVIIDSEGNIGVRKGVQKAKYTVNGNAKFYAASSDLIVAVIDEPTFTGGFANVTAWGESKASLSSETYYVALPTSEIRVENSGEDVTEKYTVTITDLLDLRTMKIVDECVFRSNTSITLDLSKALYADEHGVITEANKTIAEAFKAAALLEGHANDMTFTDIAASNITFTDGDSVTIAGGALNLPNALAGVTANVVTIDATGLDTDKYDFDRLALNVAFDAENGLGGNEIEITEEFSGYEYSVAGDVTEQIHEPTEGILDQFILDSEGMEILVPLTDAKTYDGAASITVTLKIMASYNEDTGVLTLNVAKILTAMH